MQQITAYRIALNIILELVLGWGALFIISRLIMTAGKKYLQRVTKDRNTSKTEIQKARRWMYLVWTLIVAAINLYILS